MSPCHLTASSQRLGGSCPGGGPIRGGTPSDGYLQETHMGSHGGRPPVAPSPPGEGPFLASAEASSRNPVGAGPVRHRWADQCRIVLRDVARQEPVGRVAPSGTRHRETASSAARHQYDPSMSSPAHSQFVSPWDHDWRSLSPSSENGGWEGPQRCSRSGSLIRRPCPTPICAASFPFLGDAARWMW